MPLMTAGQLVLAVPPCRHRWVLSALMVPVALGGPLVAPAATAVLLDAVPQHRAGMAGAVFNTGRQLGGALAVAVFGGLLAGQATVQAVRRRSATSTAASSNRSAPTSRLSGRDSSSSARSSPPTALAALPRRLADLLHTPGADRLPRRPGRTAACTAGRRYPPRHPRRPRRRAAAQPARRLRRPGHRRSSAGMPVPARADQPDLERRDRPPARSST
jgi:MFS family permease